MTHPKIPAIEDLLGGPAPQQQQPKIPDINDLLGNKQPQIPDINTLLGQPEEDEPFTTLWKNTKGVVQFIQNIGALGGMNIAGSPSPESMSNFLASAQNYQNVDWNIVANRAIAGAHNRAKDALGFAFPALLPSLFPTNEEERKQGLSQAVGMLRPDRLAAGILGFPGQIAGSTIGALTGMDTENDLQQLPPEKRVQAIFDAASNAAMIGASSVVGGALEKGAIASRVRDIAAAESPTEMLAAFRAGTNPSRLGSLARNLATTAAGGGALGLVSGFGEPDESTKIFLNGVMFAPIGEIMSLGRNIGLSSTEVGRGVAKQAVELWRGRQLQITTNDSFQDVAFKLRGLETSDNVAEAIIKGRIVPRPDQPVVVPGISSDQMGQTLATIASGETKVSPQFYHRPDGLYDMMVGTKPMGDRAVRSFRETGLIPEQLVEVNGTTFKFRSLAQDGTTAILQNVDNGRVVRRPRADIRNRPDLETHKIVPDNVVDYLWSDIRSRMMADAAGAAPTPAVAPTTGQVLPPEPAPPVQPAGAPPAGQVETPSPETFNNIVSELRTSKETVGAGMGKKLLTNIGANMYKFDISSVVVREGIQNAVDAVRGKFPGGAGGKVSVHIDTPSRSIIIQDNGTGMAPEVAQKEFMDPGESLKPAGAAGGLGMAKVGLFLNSKMVNMQTVAETPKGKMRTDISGSGEDWVNGTMKYAETKVPDELPTGTTLDIQLNDEANVSWWKAEDLLGRAVHYNRAPTEIAGYVDGYSAAPPYDATAHTEPAETLKAPGANLHITPSNQTTGSEGGNIKVHVLNNGAYQFAFDENTKFPNVPKAYMVNVESTVPVSDSSYPFPTSREELKDHTMSVVKDFLAKAQVQAGRAEVQALHKLLLNSPKIGSTEYQVISSAIPKVLSDHIANSSYTKDLVHVLDTLTARIVERMRARMPIDQPRFGGLGLEQHYLGVNILTSAVNDLATKAGETALPYSENLILYNPYAAYAEIIANYVPNSGKDLATTLAEDTWGTLVHEDTHQLVRGHGEEFAGTMTRLIGASSEDRDADIAKLTAVWRKVLAHKDFDFHYKEVKSAWARNKQESVLKKVAAHEGGRTVDNIPVDLEGRAPTWVDVQPPENAPEISGTGGARLEGTVETSSNQSPTIGPSSTSTGTGFNVGGTDLRSIIADHRPHPPEPKGPNLQGPVDETLNNAVPKRSFNNIVESYARQRGFDDKDTEVLKAEMTQKLYQETFKALPPEEQKVIQDRYKEVEGSILKPGASASEQIRLKAQATSEDVVRQANSNGMYVSEEPGHNLLLRDSLSDRIVGRFKKNSEAIEFIEKSAQAHGIDLDRGSMIPGRLGSGLPPIDGGPHAPPPGDQPYAVLPNRFLARLTDLVNTSADWATPNRNIMTSLDNMFGSRFFARIYDPLQVGRMRANAAIRPWYEKLTGLDKIADKMSKADREIAQGWLEARSQAELEATGGLNGGPMDKTSVAIGRHIARLGVDLGRVIPYMNEVSKLNREVKKGIIQQADLPKMILDTQQQMGMDAAHLEAASLIDAVRGGKGGYFAPVAQLVSAIQNKDLSRADYAKLHKMTGSQLALGNGLVNLHRELAKTYGIPEDYRFEDLMAHARLYTKGDVASALRDFNVPPAVVEFYTALGQTGELSSYEKDPVRAMQRYIKAGFDSRLMTPAVKEAFKAMPEELDQIPPEARGKAQRMVERYINDVRGLPAQASNFTNVGVKYFLGKLGSRIPIDVRQNIVNTILSTGEAAFQGFRVVAGLRDFTQGVSWYYTRFGLARTTRMLEYGVKGLDGVTKADLQAGGLTPELSPVFFSAPTEFTGTKLGTASNKVARFNRWMAQQGLDFSGQKNVYALLHAGSYLETFKMAGDELTKLGRNETTKEKAYGKLSIDTYEPATIKEFDRLVDAHRTEDAARLLARETGREQVGVYGSGNNPGGWNRNIGRIAGQFGTWSMWMRSQLMRAAGRGTYANRAAAMMRLAVTQGAVYAAGAATGMNLANWYIPTGILFTGGPMATTAEDVVDAIQGQGVNQDLAIRRLQRILPYDPWHDEFNIGHAWLPGSYFAKDLHDTYQMMQAGDPRFPLRAIGFKPSQ